MFNIFMAAAIEEAKKAFGTEDIPVGAVIVKDGKIIAKAYQQAVVNNDATHHAGLLAVQRACAFLGSVFLEDCDMFVTREPCPMCTGAIMAAGISNLYYGVTNPLTGANGSVCDLLNKKVFGFKHNVTVYGGIMEKECLKIMKTYEAEKKGAAAFVLSKIHLEHTYV